MMLGRMWASSAALTCALVSMTTAPVAAQEGSVQIPLSEYNALTNGGNRGPDTSHAYTFSQVRADVTVHEENGHSYAEVAVQARVNILTAEWTMVPLANAGAAITEATVGGQPAGLVTRGGSMVWPTNQQGQHDLRWTYRIDTRRYGEGRVLVVGLPRATARLTLRVPGTDRGVTVIPSTNLVTANEREMTRVTATLPASGGAQIAWRDEGSDSFTLSRAHYRGRLEGDLVRFEVELTVELDGNERVLVPLFPVGVALEEVRVDRAEAAVANEEGTFVVPVRGRGRHRITAVFQVSVIRGDGLPGVDLAITPTPVSRFELTLPGERELTVEPHAGVTVSRRDGHSIATFHVPMSSFVRVRWAEAVPEDAQEIETRAHAEVIHIVRPDEGVLAMRAYVSWEITRGAMSRAELALPPDVQVNAVTAPSGVVSDWRVSGEGDDRVLSVFLDREVEGSLALEVEYERSWPVRTRESDAFEVPLLRVNDVHRQRGMVALLATRELTLEPRAEEHVSRVGDNLLPPAIRDQVSGTVAHTFRYLDESPRLVAIGVTREPEPPRFDALIDTLVSLGDVSTTVTTMIEIDVKSGTLDVLELRVPEGLNLLEVSAPSLRRYTLSEDGVLRIEFTQPMEGRFRVEAVCERITGHEEELEVPLLGVPDAEVERGRLGVEALAPFQVDASTVERLSPIDPSELPEQLLLRTDNPILHAYRYAQADPAPRLTVRITRHAEIEIPHAVVEEAHYRTLYTRDGVAVTTARFMVRNRRQQFLRLRLPEGSEVWSARVDGRAQTPALDAQDDEDEPTVLLNIVSAAQAFPVEVVYATPVPSLGAFGRLRGQLPVLDVVVTRTTWEVYVPGGASYSAPDTAMTLISRSGAVGSMVVDGVPDQMTIEVPADGVRYVFEKMYAGRNGEVVAFSLPYVSGWGQPFVTGLSLLGALLLCLGLLAFAVLRLGFPVPAGVADRLPVALATYRNSEDVVSPPVGALRRGMLALGAVSLFGTLLLGVSLGYLSASAWPAVGVVAFFGVGALGMVAKQKIDRRRAEVPQPEPPQPETETETEAEPTAEEPDE